MEVKVKKVLWNNYFMKIKLYKHKYKVLRFQSKIVVLIMINKYDFYFEITILVFYIKFFFPFISLQCKLVHYP